MDVMVALVGALASIVSYAPQASEATVKSANPEVDRLATALEMPLRNSNYFRRPYSRYEIAVFVNAAVATAESAFDTFEKESAAVARDGWSREAESHRESLALALRQMRAFRANRKAVEGLATSFRSELKQLGVDVDSLPHTIALLSERAVHAHPPIPDEAFLPFPDVPSGHWAAGALQNLRKERIVRGYPGGRFGG
jgi:hypothetical protein